MSKIKDKNPQKCELEAAVCVENIATF